MQCLGCGVDNKVLLMDVLRGDTMKVPVIEHQIYMCSACRHIARRLVFRRAEVSITHSPVTPISVDTFWKERVAAPRTWRNAVEQLRSRQIDIKERAAAAKIAGWTKTVEKVRSKQAALAEQAACARPVAKVRARQVGRPHSLRTLSGKSRRSAFAVEIDIDRIWSLAGRSETEPEASCRTGLLRL
jgi:hypothetical protein